MLRKQEMHLCDAQYKKEEQARSREKIISENTKNDTFYNNKIRQYHQKEKLIRK